MDQLSTILEQLKPAMTETLRQWIRTPSVKGEAEPGAPFGRDVRHMLDKALADCEALGFPTKNVDGYAGHADLGEGPTEDALAILAHLDVVPVGDNWTKEPFGAAMKNGYMFGRGTSDDKGPAVAALYAMAAVRKAGIPLKRKVRLILGCDEESGWEDMKYYAAHETLPEMGFSPDADYPVINIEKGQLALRLNASPAKDGLQILRFYTGDRTNVIPGTATALVAGGDELIEKAKAVGKQHNWPVSARRTNEGIEITCEGIPGHAAYPEGGRNAIGQMLVILSALGAEGPVKTLADTIGTTYWGENLGAYVEDQMSGKLTCNMGIIRVDKEKVYATLDMRCPVLADHGQITASIRRHLPGFEVTVAESKEPHYVPEESELVQGLLDAYHDVTGLEKKALAIGGGTYAKVLRQGVAFGASFPGDPEVAHQADEHIRMESLYQSMNIFAKAIVNLAGK